MSGTDEVDAVINYGTNVTINVGAGDDTILNAGANVIINGEAGADSISNFATNVLINGGAGVDTIYNFGDIATLNGGNGDDVILNGGASVRINGGSGADYIYSAADDVTVNGGTGKKQIDVGGNNLYVDAGNDSDKIEVDTLASNATVIGGTGEDSIYDFGTNVYIDAGSDDDVIAIRSSAVNATINGGSGDDFITNYGENISINGGNDHDFIVNYASSVTAEGGAGDDLITSDNASLVAINGGNGDDYISVGGALSTQVTIGGGAGSDSIFNEASAISINGGSDDDSIENNGDYVTIAGGEGNDIIRLSGKRAVIQYDYIDGSDTVYGYDSTTTLSLSELTFYTTQVSGTDVIVSVGNDSITLVDAADKKLNIDGGVSDIWNYTPNITLRGTSNADTLQNNADGVTIQGLGGNDLIVNVADSNSVRNTIDGGAGNDTLESSDFGETFICDAGDGNDVILGFDSLDVLYIANGTVEAAAKSGKDYVVTVSGYDTLGTVTLKNVTASKMRRKGNYFVLDGGANRIFNAADSVKVVGSTFNDSIMSSGRNVTINGGLGNDTVIGSSNAELIQFAADGGYDCVANFGAGDSLAVVNGSIQNTSRSDNDIIVDVKSALYAGAITLGGAANYVLNQSDNYITVEDRRYVVNRDDNTVVSGSSKADYISNSGENVTIRSGKGKDTIEGSNFGEVFAFAYTYGNNVITNFGVNDTLRSTSGSLSTSIKGDDVVVSIAKNATVSTVTLKGAAAYNFNLSGNALTVDNVNPIDNADSGIKITGTGGADYIVNTGENVTIASGKGKDTITGSDLYAELFQFAATSDKNVITNFGAGDSLQMTQGTSMTYKKSGKNIVVTLAGAKTAKVTLQGAAGLDLSANGSIAGSVLTAVKTATIDNHYDYLKVSGTAGNDYIINSGEHVSIQPGKGNDTIEGSIFSEMFMFGYAAGNNVITNFGVNDTIHALNGSISSAVVGDDLVVSINKGSKTAKITLQGAGNFDAAINGNDLFVDGINYIENEDDNAAIGGTSGNDLIVNYGNNVTIVGSKGKDTMIGNDQCIEIYTFAYTHGNNVIKNFGTGDRISMTSGSSIATQKSGADYIVSITRGSTTAHITLEGAAEVGTLQKSTNGKAYILRSNSTIVLTQAPTSAEDYWFMSDDATNDELGELLDDATLDNAIGMLESDSAISLGSARIDQITALAKHQSKK